MLVLRNKEFSFGARLNHILGGAGIGAALSQIIAVPIGLGNFKVWGGLSLSGAILGAIGGNRAYNVKKQKEDMDKWVEDNRENLQKLVSNNYPKNLDNIINFCKELDYLNVRYRKFSPAWVECICPRDEEDLIKSLGYTFYYCKVLGKDIPNYNSVPIMVSNLDLGSFDDLKDPTDIDKDDEEAPTLTYSKTKGYCDSRGNTFRSPKDFVLGIADELEAILIESEGWNMYKKELEKLANKYLR